MPLQTASQLARRWLLPALLLAGLAGFFLSGAWRFASFDYLAGHYLVIKEQALGDQVFYMAVFFLIYTASTALSLPIASLLTLAGGAIFGWPAAGLVIVAATAGASIVFLAARNLLADSLARRAGPFVQRLQAGFNRDGFFWLLALRLVPAAPFWAVNIVPALAGMRLWPYIMATAIGIAPASCVYIWVATGFDHILVQAQVPDLASLTDIRIVGPLAGLAALSLLPIIWRYGQRARQGKPVMNQQEDTE